MGKATCFNFVPRTLQLIHREKETMVVCKNCGDLPHGPYILDANIRARLIKDLNKAALYYSHHTERFSILDIRNLLTEAATALASIPDSRNENPHRVTISRELADRLLERERDYYTRKELRAAINESPK